MIAKTNAIYVGKKSYVKKNKETDEKETKRCYYFMTYEEENENGFSVPEIKSMVVSDNERNAVAESLKKLDKCVLCFDVIIGFEGKTYFKPVSVEK